VGGAQTLHVDVRIIAATNRDLREAISGGDFREDLFHRLSVFPVHLPPLRERPADILPLALYLLEDICARLGISGIALSPAARDQLLCAPWPGNIRELGNALERAAILSDNGVIEPEHLGLQGEARPPRSAGATLKDKEREAIVQALKQTDGHRKKAAALLGMGLRTLYTKLKEYDLEQDGD